MSDFRVGEKVGFQTYSLNDHRVMASYVGEIFEIIYEPDFTFYHIAADFDEEDGETRTRLFRYIPEDRIIESFDEKEEVEESSADEVMDSRDIFDMLVERIEMCNLGDIRVGYCEDCPLRSFEYEGLGDICEEVLAWKRKRGSK